MSLFKKPKRSFRSRRQTSDDEDGNDGKNESNNSEAQSEMETCQNSTITNSNVNTTTQQAQWTTAQSKSLPLQSLPVSVAPAAHELGFKNTKKTKKKENLPKVPSASSVLSFQEGIDDDDGDDEVEEFKIKRSSHSRRVAKQLKKESRKEKEDRERLEREAANAIQVKQLNLVKKEQEDRESDTLNGKFPSMQIKSEKMEVAAEDGSSSEEDGEGNHHSFSKPFSQLLQSGQIPDATLIHLARKRRQQQRERGGEDFVPLDDTVKTEKKGSRLIRDDDNDHSEDDEDDERISFSTNNREQHLRKIQTTMLAAAEESDGSEHGNDWEMQQIRKGVGIPAQQSSNGSDTAAAVTSGAVYADYQQRIFGHSGSAYPPHPGYGGMQGGMQQQTAMPTLMPPKDAPVVNVDQIKKRMQDRLSDMCSVHRAHVHEHDDLESRIESCTAAISQLESSTDRLEEQSRFFQEMRGYVRDLIECLNEKMPTLQSLETLMLNLWTNRSDRHLKRRQDDIKDLAQEFSSSKVLAAATMIDVQDPPRQRRSAEREGRRARRRRAREAKGITDHNDGMSTDDEENQGEIAKFNMDRDRLSREAAGLMEDVLVDFSECDHIRQRFEAWKSQYTDTYQEAYIGLCLPKLFTPIIRIKLLQWNPLQEGCQDFESMAWYEAVMFYGFQEDVKLDNNDSDIKLVPSLVEKVLLPKLTALAERVWDPMSSQQTSRFVSLLKRLEENYPVMSTESKYVRACIKAVVLRIRKTLDDDIFMPLYPPQVFEKEKSGASMFFHRQFWSCIKLLGNILQWHGVIADDVLQELVFEGLFNRYLLLAISTSQSNDMINKCQAMTTLLPRAWFRGLESDSTLPQLQNFCRFLVFTANKLDQVTKGGQERKRREARDTVKQITKILVNLHATDHALSLAGQFSLKI